MKITGKGSLSSALGAALTIAWYLLFVVMGGIVIGIVIMAMSPASPSGTLAFDAQFVRLAFSGAQIGNPKLATTGTLAVVLVAAGVAEIVVFHLRKLLANIRDGHLFAAANSRHIRAIGLAAIGGAIVNALVCLAVGLLVTRSLHVPGVEVSARAGSPMMGIFLGLVILVLAQVFQHGAELQEDHDLTV
jgi:hypothetical protein